MTLRFLQNRREFLQSVGAAGLTVIYTRLAEAGPAADTAQQAAPANTWSGPPGKARYRIEGVPKVTGAKIYARDFRARDMEGWPAGPERYALVLRTTVVDRPFQGIDLSVLPPELLPQQIITAEKLADDKITFPSSMTPPVGRPGGLLVAQGKLPVYFGQPAVILIFTDFATWRQASRRLQFHKGVVKYGPAADPDMWASPQQPPYSPPTYLTRVAKGKQELFSQVKDGQSNPTGSAPVDREARKWRADIKAEFNQSDVTTFTGTYDTQVLDPVFMEPEAGLGWLEPAKDGQTGGTLHLVLGTQSTNGDFQTTLNLFSNAGCPVQVSTIVLNSCYPGGGFGGRDVSTVPVIMALAAAYAGGPVRLAYDRYEQFQSGLKQLGATVTPRLAIGRDGRFRAIEYDMVLKAGGNNNYSQWVAQLAAYCGGGSYDIDKVAINAGARPTPGVVAGSMRGFGGPQAFFGIECLIDEAAETLKIDPIALRLRNVLKTGDRTVTGAPIEQAMRLKDICERAAATPLWADRAAEKQRRDTATLAYGVGFALSNQAFGTGGDGVMAEVSLAPDGRITMSTNAVDMGNGSATSLAVSTAAALGANADAIAMGKVVPFVAGLGFDSTLPASEQVWTNPRYTASFSMSSSACLTGFHQVHAAEQAARMLFLTGILPTARVLWRARVAADKVRWKDGALTARGRRPLPLAEIAAAAHARKGVVGAMVHAYNQARWVVGTYTVDGVRHTGPIDGLSTRLGGEANWRIHDRQDTKPPPANGYLYGRSHYAPSGTLAAVEVNRDTGAARVIALHTYLDSGRVIQPDLLTGQYEGGAAMGIGYALLENLPLLKEGGGSGRWNLDRYSVPLAGDVPLDRLTLELLGTEDANGKGIAEAVLCPIAPAIVNAIAHAVGRRFRSLPVTAADIRQKKEPA
ncbi:CO/xanthine dehydrogenase Mo-binding subunit [Azospirillum fermentarium]|uniref:xanthine dehydrogenase family protein molybdopterin-binding subunit n=1 Tax=Azospirillum fermentarium TaxID=1233114 RepID=UPI002227AF74|nr:molybdopterin cofactor-binding domain-containing protein [Azospirillum fermentarium]MCW2244849.1 CO/xanthine dehydrogenase Mo-binding subunit [Azospirillum fermentarium]